MPFHVAQDNFPEGSLMSQVKPVPTDLVDSNNHPSSWGMGPREPGAPQNQPEMGTEAKHKPAASPGEPPRATLRQGRSSPVHVYHPPPHPDTSLSFRRSQSKARIRTRACDTCMFPAPSHSVWPRVEQTAAGCTSHFYAWKVLPNLCLVHKHLFNNRAKERRKERVNEWMT